MEKIPNSQKPCMKSSSYTETDFMYKQEKMFDYNEDLVRVEPSSTLVLINLWQL